MDDNEQQRIERLREQLASEPGSRLYAVLDAASVPGLPERLASHDGRHCCLFSGDLHPEVAQTAPYLVALTPNHELLAAVLGELWGRHPGILAALPGELPFRDVRKHFKRFLTVRSPAGQAMLFRYYDPRVLQVYLPTCNTGELHTVFGDVLFYALERPATSDLLVFCVREGELVTAAMTVEGAR